MRHDMYTAVHKGLRAQLFDTAAKLSRCDFSDALARGEVLAQVRTTLAFLDEHAGHEDGFVEPLLAEANPQLARRVADAHERVEQGGAMVEGLVTAIEAADADVAMGRGPELCHAFNVVLSQHVEHMNEEETLANAALWQAFSDEKLLEVHGALLGSIAPPRFAEWMALMLPALSHQERVGMLAGMKQDAPPEAFQSMMSLGRQVVGEPWGAVEAALT